MAATSRPLPTSPGLGLGSEVVRAALLVLAVAACATVELPVPVPPVSRGMVRIRSFTEPSPITALAAVGRFVFVVNGDGIERWDRDGNSLELSATHGLPSSEIRAIAPDPSRRWLWIAMPGALGRYDAANEIYEELSPPEDLAGWLAASDEPGKRRDRPPAPTAMAPARGGGVWLATERGLLHAGDEGWAAQALPQPALALADSDAGLVLATQAGLLLRGSDGALVALGADQGCAVTHPRLLLPAPHLGGTLAIGEDAAGGAVLAVGRGTRWHSYRVLPSVALTAAAIDGDGVLLVGAGQLHRLALRDHEEVRPLARDGVRLSAMGGDGPELELAQTQLQLPPGATSLEVSDEHVLLGTRDIGVARYAAGELRPGSWLRRRRMLSDATTLSVACTARDDCWLATGSRSAWHWTGDGFAAGGPDEVVLAVVRDRSGFVLALHREARDSAIRLSRVDSAGQWAPIPKVVLSTPGKDPEVSFVRAAPSGALWVGLRYREGLQVRPWGIAIVELGSGRVQYHHAMSADELRADELRWEERTLRDERGAPPRMMPVPRGVVDAEVRSDAAWFATSEGVARLALGVVQLWNENSGLRSELVRAVALGLRGAVYAATPAGVGRYLDGAWTFPPLLGFEVNDLAVASGGQLWMATPRGIAAFDGSKVRRVDVRRGLVENQVLDLAIDRYDRIWGRGPGSLTLISPVAVGAADKP